ncbi:MAG: TolC family protein [Muribaculaceae bacterium]|nr:TolC family protein [Muribaculaceae bacterium]
MNEKHISRVSESKFEGCGIRRALLAASLTIAVSTAIASPATVELRADSLPASYGFSYFSDSPLPDSEKWWETFNDPNLTRLMSLAAVNNYDIKAMLKRIEAARQVVRQAKSGYYPTIGLSAGYDVSRASGREAKPYDNESAISFFTVGATMSWEVDVFGRVSAKVKADKAAVEASQCEFAGMQLSLAAQVGSYYSALRMYEEELKVARTHLKTQQEILAIAEARYKAGLVSKLDVVQAQNVVSTTELMIPEYESEVATSRVALATLCGVTYQDIAAITDNDTRPQLVPPSGIGIPADLIRRRPDIAQAEKDIEQLAAQLGVAKKEYLPSLTLNATIGTSAHDISDLFGKNSMSFEVAPTLSWTLFDGFARSAAVAEAKAQMEAEIDDYNMTIATAIQEVENAMAKYEASKRQLALYDDVMTNSKELVDLALERYRSGLSSFTDVAGAQVTYLTNQTNYEVSRANCFVSLINLYKALGGGFRY